MSTAQHTLPHPNVLQLCQVPLAKEISEGEALCVNIKRMAGLGKKVKNNFNKNFSEIPAKLMTLVSL